MVDGVWGVAFGHAAVRDQDVPAPEVLGDVGPVGHFQDALGRAVPKGRWGSAHSEGGGRGEREEPNITLSYVTRGLRITH